MTEFKLGDKVLYKTINMRGIITGKPSPNLWAVWFEDKSSRYCLDRELELIEPEKEAKGCMYCKHGEPLNDTSNSNFSLVIRQGESSYYLESEYDPGEWNDNDWGNINYCPMCGRKLEVAE